MERVLIVDDDPDIARLVSYNLSQSGLDTVIAGTGREALRLAQEEPPVLIILDLNFSAVEPLKLISKVKSNGEMKQISVIGYLSHVQGELKQQAQEAGANIVMARSAFSQNLQQILKRHSGVV